MTMPTRTGGAPKPRCRDIGLAAVVLVAGFLPALFMAPFLGYQAWWAFAEPEAGSPLWGVVCSLLILAPFVGALVAGRWRRKNGTGIPGTLLVSALTAFTLGVTSCAVIPFLYLLLALAA